ncbi:MAG: hypothetical protein LBN08_00215 [Lactobacillales bacterium]|nr:hypothetical protein [Lactobacillales bacterium]
MKSKVRYKKYNYGDTPPPFILPFLIFCVAPWVLIIAASIVYSIISWIYSFSSVIPIFVIIAILLIGIIVLVIRDC